MWLYKSYRAINREICKGMTPFEVDLARFVAMKDRHFIGKDALLRQKEVGEYKTLINQKLPFCDTSVIAHEAV